MNNKKRVVITDDSVINQELITDILGDQYTYVYADNGAKLIDYLSNGNTVDIILLDINMPVMDGFEVLRIMNERHWIEEIPVVVISAESELGFLQKAYSLGATDYIPRPFSAVTVRFRVENTLMLYSKQRQLVQLVEEQVYEREEINNAMINIFSHTLELRNNESGKHTLNIRNISEILLHRLASLTNRYDLSEKRISVIIALSSLHDIGKIVIPKRILNKPGKLTDEEWQIMKTHAEQGDEIIGTTLMQQTTETVKTAREICRWHHERWDGKGYPDGLVGDEIPISAQVVSLADVYDALTSDRCYKKAFSHEQAIDMILRGECGAFNPLLLQCLKEVSEQLRDVCGKQAKSYDYSDEAQKLTIEMLKNRSLPMDDRTERLLANEKAKKEFFKAVLGGIQFEYDCPSQKLTYINRYEDNPVTRIRFLDKLQDDEIHVLTAKDWNTLFEAMHKTTRENPDVALTVLIEVRGEYRWHKLYARSIWPVVGNEYITVLGQFTDIHDQIANTGIRKLVPADKAGAELAFQLLKNIFNVVRLVDPTDYSVQRIADDGTIIKSPAKCYQIWNRKQCCENCSSAEALKCHGLVTKLESKDNDLYSVISKYLNIDGKDYVLEIAFNMAGDKGKSGPLPERVRLLLLNFYKDSLTGAYSRMYLEDFKSSLEDAAGVAIIDIDNFKHINDTYGHPVGDKALAHIAGIIEKTLGAHGVVIRYGGDEFLLIFRDISEYEFQKMMSSVKQAVHTSHLPEYPDLSFEISIGGSYRAETLAEAISEADKEMYKNKPQRI